MSKFRIYEEFFVHLLLYKISTDQGTCACISCMEVFERDCCIRSYHVYNEIWRVAIGEKLECDKNQKNHVITIAKNRHGNLNYSSMIDLTDTSTVPNIRVYSHMHNVAC